MDHQWVVEAFETSATTKRQFSEIYAKQIIEVAQVLIRAFNDHHKVLLFGNGGSATDASHIAAEFVGRYKQDRTALPAIALTTDSAALTCIANDYDYSEIFSRQVEALGRKGDVAIAISTSGNSPNVLRGIQIAHDRGLITIGWTGQTGGQLMDLVDYCFQVPSTVTARIQECHITLGHVLCEIIEERLFAQTP